jgi:hypothetical protein
MLQQGAGVVFAVVKESSHLTAYLGEPRGERPSLEHLRVGGVQET